MTSLSPLLQNFFSDRLIAQKNVTSNTLSAYRDTFRIFLKFSSIRLKTPPHRLNLEQIDEKLVGEFLNHLESVRKNSIRTRNARLAAIRSFFHFLGPREPAHLDQIQRVIAIPQKKFTRNIIQFLDASEVEAILSTPDLKTWIGRRDHALLHLLAQTGLRVSELTQLKIQDLHLGPSPHVRCYGKGRKERATPLTAATVRHLKNWLKEISRTLADPLFPSQKGTPLSRDAIEWMIKKYARSAELKQPSLRKKLISPHVFRHTAAVSLLQAGVDRSVIALWLGHEQVETTQIYLHADLSIKEKALARTTPISIRAGFRFKPDDDLLAFLQTL